MDAPFPASLALPAAATSLLCSHAPHDALCRHYGVSAPPIPGAHVLRFLDLSFRARDAVAPTHVLALVAPTTEHRAPVLAPISSSRYVKGFRTHAFISQLPDTSLSPPLPHYPPGLTASTAPNLILTLPVIPLAVPHPPTLPLLLLFGLRLEKQLNLLAWRLLPAQVIVEFPHAAAMADVLANGDVVDEREFEACLVRNHGIWKNVLALGPRDQRVVEMIQMVWNVTADAKRKRQAR